MLRGQASRLAHASRAHHIAKAQRGRKGFRQRPHIPHPVGGQRAQRRLIGHGGGIAFILDDLQIVPVRDGYNLLHPSLRHLRRGGVLPVRRQAQNLRAVAAAGRLQRVGAHPLGVQVHPHHFGPCRARGIAETWIRQVFGQHHRPVTAQTTVQDQANAVLPAMRQHDVLWPDRPQHPRSQPAAHLVTQGQFLQLAWIIKPFRRVLQRHTLHRRSNHSTLPDIGQRGGPQVKPPLPGQHHTLGIGQRLGPQTRHARGNKGAAPHRGLQQPLAGGDLIGAADGARRQRQFPRQIAHRRQLRPFGQFAPPNRLAQHAGQGQVFWPFAFGQVWAPNCIHDNVPLARAGW